MGWNRELGSDSNPQAAVVIGSSSSSDLEFGSQRSDLFWSLAVLFLLYARFIPDACCASGNQIKPWSQQCRRFLFLGHPNFPCLGGDLAVWFILEHVLSDNRSKACWALLFSKNTDKKHIVGICFRCSSSTVFFTSSVQNLHGVSMHLMTEVTNLLHLLFIDLNIWNNGL